MNQSVIKAFEVLSFVIDNPRKMSLSEMARALDMNKTTLFRFLSTLETLGMLDRREDQYVPGMKLFAMGNKVPVKELIVDRVHPILKELTEEVNETVNLGQLIGNRMLYLTKSESRRSLQIQTYVGGYISLHCSALGKAVLSILPEPRREEIIAGLDFKVYTPKTITDPDILRIQVGEVAARGYSTDIAELEEGLNCVAVPLWVPHLNFTGAISTSGPSVRFTTERIAELAGRLQGTVAKIQEILAD